MTTYSAQAPSRIVRHADRWRYQRLLRRAVLLALLMHLGFIALFYFLGAETMAAVNLGSVLLFGGCLFLLRLGRLQMVLVLVTLEVMVHAWAAVQAVGWDSGFQYYLFVLTPVALFHFGWRLPTRFGYVAALCAAYLLIGATAPADPGVAPELLSRVHAVNVITAFAFIAYLAHHYSEAVTEVEEELRVLATTDPLTGLYNRRRILEIAESERRRRARAERGLAVIIADVDGFKQVNDGLGHQAGDAVLRALAERLRGLLRAQDAVARWGGEEFLFVLPETDLDGAIRVAEKLRAAVAGAPVDVGGRHLALHMSFGVSQLAPQESIESCVVRADRALLEAKRQGKNRVLAAAPYVPPPTRRGGLAEPLRRDREPAA